MRWRWDQGRLDYFQYGEIEQIARALCSLDHAPLPRRGEPDILREQLARLSARPFAPSNYKVWRNYKRVFGCQMLATEVKGMLVCTELAKALAQGGLSSDSYFLHIANHFSLPSPVFDDYETLQPEVFPFCAAIKLLLSDFLTRGKPRISMDEIIDRVIGNEVNGSEPLGAFAGLKETGYTIDRAEDEYRQIREMIRFISQASFLKWDNPFLILDVSTTDEAASLAPLLQPHVTKRYSDPELELLRIGELGEAILAPIALQGSWLNPYDLEFTEGNRSRVSHLRSERSEALRSLYFAHRAHPSVCDVCEMDTLDHYPWALKLIELHHLLPLSSPVRVGKEKSSLDDIVGLCPTCHRAVHRYYQMWLGENEMQDFRAREEAKSVYVEAKAAFDK